MVLSSVTSPQSSRTREPMSRHLNVTLGLTSALVNRVMQSFPSSGACVDSVGDPASVSPGSRSEYGELAWPCGVWSKAKGMRIREKGILRRRWRRWALHKVKFTITERLRLSQEGRVCSNNLERLHESWRNQLSAVLYQCLPPFPCRSYKSDVCSSCFCTHWEIPRHNTET
jgi:hypothetical protein